MIPFTNINPGKYSNTQYSISTTKMRKVILNLAVTLDGFIEGPNGEVDWCSFDEVSGPDNDIESHFDTFLESIDTIFYGRVSYEMWGEYQPATHAPHGEKKLWENVHKKKKYVFSSSPKQDNRVTYINTDIAKTVLEIKAKAGKDIWMYGGAGLITSFMNMKLIDKYLIAVYPMILGSGKPLFSAIQNRIGLKLIDATPSKSGVILLNYETDR